MFVRPALRLRFFRKTPFLTLLLSMLLLAMSIASRNAPAISPLAPQQQQVQPNSGQPGSQAPTVLEPGKPIERELAGGQTHSYEIRLQEGQYASIIVEQRGIDVVVQRLGSDSQLIAEYNSESRLHGQEKAELLAEVASSNKLNVRAQFARVRQGRYQIRVGELRAATDKDRSLQEASAVFTRALLLYRAQKYNEARALVERAAQIREETLGPDHLEFALILKALANIHFAEGGFPQAESLYLRSLAIMEKTVGPDHPEFAGALMSLGGTYQRRGDYAKAEPLRRQALNILENTLPSDNPLVALALNNLANLYLDQGSYAKAEPLYVRALEVYERSLAADDYVKTITLNNLGSVYGRMGDFERAEPLFRRVLDIREKTLGKDNPGVAIALNNLGSASREQGKYATAEAFYLRALSIFEKAMGPGYPGALESLTNLAIVYAAKGDPIQSVAYQARASAVTERNIALNLVTGSERQKLAFLSTIAEAADRTVSLHTLIVPDNSDARNLAATTVLLRKGRVLDAMSDSIARLRERFNFQDQTLLDQLNETTSELARLVLNGPQRVTLVEHEKQIKSLEERREKLENEVSRRSAGFYERTEPIALTAVQAAIPPNAALIEFCSYRPFDPKASGGKPAYGNPRYVAYVLHRQGEVQWKELGEVKPIHAAIDEWRKALRDPKRTDVQQLARTVDEKLMQQLRPLLGNVTQLLLSPDEALNLIPFEALIDEDNRYLVERYTHTYLTSGRDLLRLRAARNSSSNPLVLADPSFGQPETTQVAMATVTRTKPARIAKRQSVTTGSDLSAVYFAPLGGTAQEARAIKAQFPEATMLAGTQATEAYLKKATAPRMLHIATHGFFLHDAPAGSVPANAPETRAISARVTIENPLLRSGLALAGANLHATSGDDGILTALEASGLNLWGTQLVTLSACDTGLGELKSGEGVYGLRRAFVLAGAETLIMSLWPVSDQVTRELMTSYYGSLKQGQGRGEALRQVQLQMLKRKERQHPFYWAGFIQSGEWANLEGKR